MKKRKQWLALLTALGIVFSMTACTDAGGTPEQTTGMAETTAVVSGDLAAETEVILPPHDDWTLEEFNQVVYFNGEHVTFPCTLNDLGEDYTLDTNITYDDRADISTTKILYKGKYFCAATFDGVNEKTLTRDSQISEISQGYDIDGIPDICINGVTPSTKYSDITTKMGNPAQIGIDEKDTETGAFWYYLGDKTRFVIFVFMDGELVMTKVSILSPEAYSEIFS